jgi:hypothetical protein
MPGHLGAAAAYQKIKIAAFVGLQYAVNVELLVTTLGCRRRRCLLRLARRKTPGDLGVAHF